MVASPASTVRDSIQDARNIAAIPSSAIATTADADTNPARCAGARVPTKMLAIRICVGQRPLHSEKLFVMIAIIRSRGLSITRVATTPAALHPKPMHIVSACLPCAPALRNRASRLNATRGK